MVQADIEPSDSSEKVNQPAAQRPMTCDEIAKMFEIDEFTCDTCPQNTTCPCRFDPYNQHGDCLMEK